MAAVMPTRRGLRSAELDDLVGEDARSRWAARLLDRLAGLRVDLPDGVELVGDIRDRGLEAVALLGDDVHDDRAAERLAPASAVSSSAGRSWP
jgi:hypothetical protein